MAQVKGEHTPKSTRSAALAVACVAVFAACFIGLVTWLDSLATHVQPEDVNIEEAYVPDEPFYVLLIGSDSRKGTALYTGKANEHAQVNQHSDIMTLMRVDPETYLITLITIPRDTVIPGQTGKINDALLENDPNEVVTAVGQLTGVYADYYMMISFTAFEDLVDALGGVTVDVAQQITVPDPASGKNVTVAPGRSKNLNGAQALVLARARKEYANDQDATRQVNVRALERALIEKVLHNPLELDVEAVLGVLERDTQTNIDLAHMGVVMLDFVEHSDDVVIYDCTGPYDGGNRESDGLWVINPDMDDWATIIELADAGEDPSTVVPAPKV